MTNGEVQTLSLYFPLWGVRFDSDEVGAIGRGVVAYVPDAEEWRTIQETDVWTAQLRSEAGRGPTPPCCIVVFAPLGSAESIDAAIKDAGEYLLSMARTAVTTLRLFRSGWFLQPEQVMYVFYASSLVPNVVRAPGPYRQVFVSNSAHLPMPRYELKLEDLAQRVDAPGAITATWELLQDYQRSGGNASVEIALESFNRSYGYQLRPASRAANLFTALDAMLGGMKAWRIGRVSINPRGYIRRVETALRNAALPDNPHDAARWLHWDRGGRGLRNAIAHGTGRAVEDEAERAYERLQAIVRAVLRQYLHFSIFWARCQKETAARLGLAAENPLAAAYVMALEAEAKQPGSVVDMLQAASIH